MTYDPEIEKLLPWYAKGLLEPHEAKAVDAYLTEHPDMRLQLDLIAEEDSAIEQQHAALGAPKPGGLDRLMADIDALEAKEAPVGETATKAATSFFEQVKSFLGGFASPGVQFAAMAAALVIVAQGVIIGGVLQQDPVTPAEKPAFTTASGPERSTQLDGALLLVVFNKDASMGAIANLLKAQSAVIVSGPKAGGFFELHVPKDKLPEGGAKAVLKAFQDNKDLVKFASLSQ